MKYLEWTLTQNHIYNKDVINCPVWVKSFERGKVYLMDSKEKSFMYTCSFGASSDNSFTGCFYELPVENVEDCKKALDIFVPKHLTWEKGLRMKDCIK